jgi:hypothetical protein
LDGFKHYVTYNVSGTTSPVYEVEKLDNFESLKCDMDGTQIEIMFHDEINSHKYYLKFKTGGAFLSGISNKTCPMKFDPSKGFLLRSVIGASVNG